jgi:SpoVK/Ycf46/Vps4 family AAA+-type ATPase
VDQDLLPDTTSQFPEPPPPYADAREYLADTLEKVRALVGRHLLRHPARHVGDDLRPKRDQGRSVDLPELRQILANNLVITDRVEDLDEWLAEFSAHMDRRLAATTRAGRSLPVQRLQKRFRLTPAALELLLTIVAPELDEDLLRAYTVAWSDFTRRQGDVAFYSSLLATSFAEQEQVRDLLLEDGPLVGPGLVELTDPGGFTPRAPVLFRRVKAAERIVEHLRGREQPSPATLGAGVSLETGAPGDPPPIHAPATREAFALAQRLAARRGEDLHLLLVGPAGCGKKSLVRHDLTGPDRPLLVVELGCLADELAGLLPRLRWCLREARLQEALVYLDGADHLAELAEGSTRRRLLEMLRNHPGPLCLGLERVLPAAVCQTLGGWPVCKVPPPGPREQEQLWARGLAGGAPETIGGTPAALARRYNLTGALILQSARLARELADAAADRESPPRPTEAHLERAIQQCLDGRLSTLADALETELRWPDLIVPPEVRQRLEEIAAFARQRETVFETWGFGAKFPYGRGISALFSGPPGTGKTMAASIIAAELGMPLFRVDLSQIVDRYVGETEKNIRRIFDAAADGHGVILFDEADSLFAKRTEVRSSSDRYANLEVNFLLQKMESFEGVTLLTTNSAESIDEAFKRRLRFRIHFPFPDREMREQLWQSMLPAAARVAPDIDFRFLAEEFEMSGGMIKSAVLRAAFLAADRDRPIDGELLCDSAAIEYAEMGRLSRY